MTFLSAIDHIIEVLIPPPPIHKFWENVQNVTSVRFYVFSFSLKNSNCLWRLEALKFSTEIYFCLYIFLSFFQNAPNFSLLKWLSIKFLLLNVPDYSWFLLQFWSIHHTTTKMLHYNSKFKIRRKSNPDSHYGNAVFKFIKIRAVKNWHNVAFFSADASYKVPVVEPDFPIASVTCNKKVIVRSNKTFTVNDHDFTKLPLIHDAHLLHELPEPDDSERSPKVGEWYKGKVYYGLKSMVTEASSAMFCAAELSEVMT